MKDLNIYMCGVGGQGIGLLSEILVQTCLKAGYQVKSVDTHGLAQRGGTVVSHLRLGKNVFSPLIPEGEADIVISLERLEGLRAAEKMLKNEGKLLYYNAVYQPIDIRLGNFSYPEVKQIEDFLKKKNGEAIMVEVNDLPDPRMQNIVLIAKLLEESWIEGISKEMVFEILEEILPEKIYLANKKLLERL